MKVKATYDMIAIAKEIMKKKTNVQLIKCMKRSLADFFGFEKCSVMLYDTGENDLFTILDQNQATSDDFIDQTVTLPNTMGITGYSF